MTDVLDEMDGYYDPHSSDRIVIDGWFTIAEVRAILADCERREAENDWGGW